MIHDIEARFIVRRCQILCGDSEANSVSDSLAERSSGHLKRRLHLSLQLEQIKIPHLDSGELDFGMSRRHTKVGVMIRFELISSPCIVTGQVKMNVLKETGVSGAKNEPITIEPGETLV